MRSPTVRRGFVMWGMLHKETTNINFKKGANAMEKKMSITEKAKGLLWNNGYIVGLYQAYLKLHSEYPNKNLMIIVL